MDSKRKEKNKKKKASLKKKFLLSGLVVILGVFALGGGYVYGMLNKLERVDLDKENLGVNEKLTNDFEYIKNIALFGVDSEDGVGRSDAMMVATIDTKNDKIKLTSFMRDTYVEIEGHGGDKLNSAYSYGQEQLAIKTLNQNFDLNIKEFVTVDFNSLVNVVDEIGGVEIEVDSEEVKYINFYINELNGKLQRSSAAITEPGTYVLDGVQAMSYCRIRYTEGDDFKRTERQREVLEEILNEVLSMSPTKYPSIINKIFPMVKTSLSSNEILGLLTDVVGIGANLEQGRFPMDGDFDFKKVRGMSCIIFDKEETSQKVHDWIFGDIDPNEPVVDEVEDNTADTE